MLEGSKNLIVERSQPSVWDRQQSAFGRYYDQEQWTAAAGGAVLALLGLRRGGLAGGLLASAGGALAARAAMGCHDLALLRNWIARQQRRTPGDVVNEASDESFPASDSPSWTPTAGTARR